MQVNRVSIAELQTNRLDPDYYKPEYLNAEDAVTRYGAFPLREAGKLFAGPFGSKLPSNLYLDEGVPLFRIGNVGSMWVDPTNMAYLAPSVHEELKSSEVGPGDLLIVKASVSEKICRVPKNIEKANITQHIAALRLNGKVDGDFLMAFLFSSFGCNQLKRRSLGSIIQYLGLTDTRSVSVPEMSSVVQNFIGNKVRQAEMLRAWAKEKDLEIQQYHKELIPEQSKLNFTKKTRLVNELQMTERLDAHFYPGVVDSYLGTNPNNFEKLADCCVSIFNGQTQPEVSEEGSDQVTVANLSVDYITGQTRYVATPSKKDKLTNAYDLLICNAAHNKSYIGRDITFVHCDRPLLPSTEVMVIRADRTKLPASYLRAYLLTKLGYIQIQSTIRGITAHSYPVDMAKLDIFIPNLVGDELSEWLLTDELLAKAGIANEFSTQLTVAAKLLVEALIEGSLTEDELIAAHQASKDGERSLDKSILRKLTHDGYAVEGGKPLFPDLDELFELQEEVELLLQDKEQY